MDTTSLPGAPATSAQNTYLARVFSWMMAGLGLTTLTALGVQLSGGYAQLFGDMPYVPLGLIIVELALVFWLSARYQGMSKEKAGTLFFVYAALNGVTLSVIAEVYAAATIASALFIATAMFGALGLFGWTTKRDLGRFGTFLFMALIGLLVAMFVGIFIQATALQWAISIAGVLIFSGLTVFDFQRIKQEGAFAQSDAAAIVSALGLYLDFINLFLFILRIFGLAGGDD
jgi:FtsH-binding integral membrane protein